MKAKLQPLSGKYYGSIIELTHKSGTVSKINIWVDDYSCRRKPSIRQIKAEGYKTLSEALGDGCEFDTHSESAVGYAVAKIIVDAINERGEHL